MHLVRLLGLVLSVAGAAAALNSSCTPEKRVEGAKTIVDVIMNGEIPAAAARPYQSSVDVILYVNNVSVPLRASAFETALQVMHHGLQGFKDLHFSDDGNQTATATGLFTNDAGVFPLLAWVTDAPVRATFEYDNSKCQFYRMIGYYQLPQSLEAITIGLMRSAFPTA